jgi:hypothetical protein
MAATSNGSITLIAFKSSLIQPGLRTIILAAWTVIYRTRALARTGERVGQRVEAWAEALATRLGIDLDGLHGEAVTAWQGRTRAS